MVEMPCRSGAANRFNVPKRAWHSWTKDGRRVFNELYSAMKGTPWAFQAPSQEKAKIKPRTWQVTCWNAAWIAAEAASGKVQDL